METNKDMIKYLISKRILRTKHIINAFLKIDRKDFVPDKLKTYAYLNEPLLVAEGQTISQPETVAIMTEALQPNKGHKILEIGSGSGYQAAILSVIVGERGIVITTEIRKTLYEIAKKNLRNYKNVRVVLCDGSKGYEKEAPYDRIIVTAEAPEIPPLLLNQLKNKGKLIIPITNKMYLIHKNKKIKKTCLGYFSFVPLIGSYGYG